MSIQLVALDSALDLVVARTYTDGKQETDEDSILLHPPRGSGLVNHLSVVATFRLNE